MASNALHNQLTVIYFTLKMKAAGSSKTSVAIEQTTRCHIPVDSNTGIMTYVIVVFLTLSTECLYYLTTNAC